MCFTCDSRLEEIRARAKPCARTLPSCLDDPLPCHSAPQTRACRHATAASTGHVTILAGEQMMIDTEQCMRVELDGRQPRPV